MNHPPSACGPAKPDRRRPLAFAAALLVSAAVGHAASLTYCSEGNPEGFDVALYETVNTEEAAGLPLYDKLLQFKPGTSQVEPGLAEQWSVSADGKAVMLKLRKGVKFHTTAWFTPTRDMNADDVVWSLQRIRDPKHPAHAAARGGFPYWAGMGMNQLVTGVEKADAMTVRITLSRPDASFLADLAMSAIASVLSAEYGEQLAKAGQLDKLNTQPVGTGPFLLRSAQKDAVIRYAAHTAYWGGRPKVDTLVYAITPDPAVRLQRLRAGECAVANLLEAQVDSLKDTPGLRVQMAQPLSTSYLALNTQKLTDVRLRQALALAVDREAYVKAVFSGYATPAASFLPPKMLAHDGSFRPKRDLQKAKQLLQAAGYDGRELLLYATARNADIQRGVALLQGDFAAIGVKVRVQLFELGELYKRTARGEHDLALLGYYSDNGDPDNFLGPNLSCAAVDGGSNKPRWCNTRFDQLLADGRASTDVARRSAAYREAQKLIAEQVPLIPIGHRMRPVGLAAMVQGVAFTPFGINDFRAAQAQQGAR
jgi:dipeptide transport system substrate-binding protein